MSVPDERIRERPAAACKSLIRVRLWRKLICEASRARDTGLGKVGDRTATPLKGPRWKVHSVCFVMGRLSL